MSHKTSENHASTNGLAIEDASGNELLSNHASDDDSPVLATDKAGNSLTLLEEYAMRRTRPSTVGLVFSFLCAAASLAFTALIFLNTH